MMEELHSSNDSNWHLRESEQIMTVIRKSKSENRVHISINFIKKIRKLIDAYIDAFYTKNGLFFKFQSYTP